MSALRLALQELQLRRWARAARRREFSPFMQSLDDPTQAQLNALRAICERNSATEFGQQFDLRSIRSVDEFRARIPIHEYEALRPFIERQIEGKVAALNPTPPVLYAQTSGTTGKPKFIPLCDDTLRALKTAQSISTYIQQLGAPGIFGGKLIALVSPMIEGHLEDGTPFGSMSGVVRHSLPEAILAKALLPQADLEHLSYDDRYAIIAAIAVCDPDVSCLASANPSTFLRLSEVINAQFPEIMRFIESGNIDELGVVLEPQLAAKIGALCRPTQARREMLSRLKAGEITFSALWPQLRGVVTWTGGNCSVLIPRLSKQLAADTRIIDMGYLASEFWGTIIVDPHTNLGAPTLTDNFFEFIEPAAWESGDRATKLLTELELGKHYYIVVTTPNGLYRYFINDIIVVNGIHRATPTIAFVQKGKGVTTLTGEKLYEGQVTEAVERACRRHGVEADCYIMLADRQAFSYTLYLEGHAELNLSELTAALNEALSEINLEYAAKVSSGRLPPAQIKRVKPNAFESFKRHAISRGQREGQFKTIKLQYRDEIAFNFEEYVCQAL